MTIPDYSSINRGFKRKVSQARKAGEEQITLSVDFLYNVAIALDELVKASKRSAVKEGTSWRINE